MKKRTVVEVSRSTGKLKVIITIGSDKTFDYTIDYNVTSHLEEIVKGFVKRYVEDGTIDVDVKEDIVKFILGHDSEIPKSKIFNYIITEHKIWIGLERVNDEFTILMFLKTFLSTYNKDVDINVLKKECMEYVMKTGKGNFNPTFVSKKIDDIIDNM